MRHHHILLALLALTRPIFAETVTTVEALVAAAAEGKSGAVIELAPGTFKLTQPLDLKSGTTLKGAGIGKTIIIRVPMMLQWKGTLPAGRIESRLASALDLTATALAAAGVAAPASLDGVNLLPPLTASGHAAPFRTHHYWRVGEQAALREGGWKIHRGRGQKTWQLHDLATDPGETRDLAAQHPERVAALENVWKKLDAEMAAPLWGPASPRPSK
jgi:hypothetical protein